MHFLYCFLNDILSVSNLSLFHVLIWYINFIYKFPNFLPYGKLHSLGTVPVCLCACWFVRFDLNEFFVKVDLHFG